MKDGVANGGAPGINGQRGGPGEGGGGGVTLLFHPFLASLPNQQTSPPT